MPKTARSLIFEKDEKIKKMKNKKKFYASNQKIFMNKYVLELRFLFVCKIIETYMQ